MTARDSLGPFRGGEEEEAGRDDIGKYGFRWGPLDVMRLAHIPRRGYRIGIYTDHQSLEIHISELGDRIEVVS